MPRAARIMAKSCVYHVLIRTYPDVEMYKDEEDIAFCKEQMKAVFEVCEAVLYCYHLEASHMHFLLKVGSMPLREIVKSLCVRYSYYYHVKYDHSGYLIYDRYKSQPVDTKTFFLRTFAYINTHQNAIANEAVEKTIPSMPDDNSQDLLECVYLIAKRIIKSRLKEFLYETFKVTTPEQFETLDRKQKLEIVSAAKAKGASRNQLKEILNFTKRMFIETQTASASQT